MHRGLLLEAMALRRRWIRETQLITMMEREKEEGVNEAILLASKS